MATCTHKVTTADTGNTPNTSGAFTPAVGDLLVVFVEASDSVDDPNALSSSVGITFTRAEIANFSSGTSHVYCFVANSLVTSATSQTVTFSPADTATGTVITVYSVAGMTRTGSSAVRQTAEQNAASGTPAPVFGSACLTGNPTLGGIGNQSNPAGLTPPTDWTEGSDTGYATPTRGLETVFRDSGFTGTTITWGSASATGFASLIAELDTSVLDTFLPSRPTSPGQSARLRR